MFFTLEQLRPFLKAGAEESLKRRLAECDRARKENESRQEYARKYAEEAYAACEAEFLSGIGLKTGTVHMLKIQKMGRTFNEVAYETRRGVLKEALIGILALQHLKGEY